MPFLLYSWKVFSGFPSLWFSFNIFYGDVFVLLRDVQELEKSWTELEMVFCFITILLLLKDLY